MAKLKTILKNTKYESIYKKLDPSVRKELNRLKRLSTKSTTDQRNFEAYRDHAFEPYLINPNSQMYFALSIKQSRILKDRVKKLNLNSKTKELIYKRTVKFFTTFRYEYHDRINFRKAAIENKGIKALRADFENEIDHALERYRKEYFTTNFSYKLTQFQNSIMDLFHEHFDDDPLEVALEKKLIQIKPEAKNWEQKLIDRFAPANRPSYDCYPPYLYDLSCYIQDETADFTPILVNFLTSFQTTEFDIFDSFVINRSSLRSLISKHRKSINKGSKI